MDRYQLFALSQMWIPMFAGAVIWFVYFLVSEAESSTRRLSAAAHGVLLLLAALYAVAISPWSAGWRNGYVVPFLLILGLAAMSLIYSFSQFKGRRATVHVLLLLLLPSAAWIWLIGTMTITHDWL